MFYVQPLIYSDIHCISVAVPYVQHVLCAVFHNSFQKIDL